MNKPILFKRTRKSIANKLSNHIYIDIINTHDKKLITQKFHIIGINIYCKSIKENKFYVRRRTSEIEQRMIV